MWRMSEANARVSLDVLLAEGGQDLHAAAGRVLGVVHQLQRR